MKMFLFRKQFFRDENFQSALKRFVMFLLKFYVIYWFRCTKAVTAPRIDLELLQNLSFFEDREISENVANKMKNHLWYLGEINVGLAFFDPELSLKVKKLMVRRLACKDKRDTNDEVRLLNFNDDYTIENYVTNKTLTFFNVLNIDTSFMFIEPEEWEENHDYLIAKQKCETLAVTNDSAERALAVATTYKDSGPNDPKDRSNMIISVARNRRFQNNSNKKKAAAYIDARLNKQ